MTLCYNTFVKYFFILSKGKTMNILVINGSPKGNYSITLQTIHYLEKKFPEHSFTILNAGQTIRGIERDFSKSRELLLAADAILFSYPVYTFVAPCQLHRFIELLKADGVDISGKFATSFSKTWSDSSLSLK